MVWALDIPVLAFLGLQCRYWAIIIVVLVVILAIAYVVRSRSSSYLRRPRNLEPLVAELEPIWVNLAVWMARAYPVG